MKPEKTLTVRLNKEFVGYLEQNQQGKMVFTYADNNAKQLSMSLPVRINPYSDKFCRGFFEGLLPEGERIRNFIGKKYGISPKNEFSLLKAIGYDCAGAVSFTDYEENPQNFDNEFIDIIGTEFTDDTLEEYISALPQKPLLTGSNGLRLSLAGAQDKMAVVLLDNIVSLPQKDVPTTHILKPVIKGIEGSIENEYICIKAAKLVGLNVCEAEIRTTKNLKYLLIKRYDRETKDGKIRRIHQEDFCQAKNIISAFKYEKEGGIKLKDCFEIVNKTSSPAASKVELINRIIFNYLIGNYDAHGKNFSILYSNNKIQLAPAYDVLCTAIYPELSQELAMKIGGYYDPDMIIPERWKKMAEDFDISYTQLRKIILKQAEILPKIIKKIDSDLNQPISKKISEFVEFNCQKTIERFNK